MKMFLMALLSYTVIFSQTTITIPGETFAEYDYELSQVVWFYESTPAVSQTSQYQFVNGMMICTHLINISTEQDWIDLSGNLGGSRSRIIYPWINNNFYYFFNVSMAFDFSNIEMEPWQTELVLEGSLKASGQDHYIRVTLQRDPPEPTEPTEPDLEVSYNSFYISTTSDQVSRDLAVTNRGSMGLNYQITTDSPYFWATPNAGSLGFGQSNNISLVGYGLPYGTTNHVFTVSANNGDTEEVTVTVNRSWSKKGEEPGVENWPDPNLREAIFAEVDKNGDRVISMIEAISVIDLDLSYLGITNLKGIQRFPNLAYLNLEGNDLTDIQPLSHLQNLLVLNLNDNALQEIPDFPKSVKSIQVQHNPFLDQ